MDEISLREKIAYVRVALPYSLVFKRYGLDLGGEGTHQIRCPFHGEDKKPSARYYADTKMIHCFACSEDNAGDVVWFVKKMENLLSMADALLFIEKNFGVSLSNTDLAKRIELRKSLEQSLPRKKFSEVYKNRINDLLYRLKKDPRVSKVDFTAAERVIWDNWRSIEELAIENYLEFCEIVRNWCSDSVEILKRSINFQS